MLRVLAINGSLRKGSHNGALLRAAAALLPSGAELVELTGLADVPAYSEDHDVSPPPPRWRRCAERWPRRTPFSSAPRSTTPRSRAQLKNALDWASRPFPATRCAASPPR